MKPSEIAKQAGCVSLQQVADEYGCTVVNIIKIAKNHPERFRTFCIGVASKNIGKDGFNISQDLTSIKKDITTLVNKIKNHS